MDGSKKCPLGILGNVPVKVCDFHVLDDFIVLDIIVVGLEGCCEGMMFDI